MKSKRMNYEGNPRIGRLPKLMGQCPFWPFFGLIVLLYLAFAILIGTVYYSFSLTSASSYSDNLYFSMITQTTIGYGDVKPDSGAGKFIAAGQAIFGAFYLALVAALLLYKLVNISAVFHFDPACVFSPDDGTLRVRCLNLFALRIVNVDVCMYFRAWLADAERFATYDVRLKRKKIPYMEPYIPWNLATVPISPTESYPPLKHIDGNRNVHFHPCYVRSDLVPSDADDPHILRVTLTGRVPVFGSVVFSDESYVYEDIHCGRIKPVQLVRTLNWKNWGKFTESTSEQCECCPYSEMCTLQTHSKNK